MEKLATIKFNVPDYPTQKRIASILSAYDDLIENNLKRIKLLEEIAQRTYEEWFVKYRVNGKQLPIDENTGLPVGWKQITVNDYVEVISKGPTLNYDFVGRKYPVINQSCIRNGEIELEKVLYAQELNANKEYCYLKVNDILINSMGQGTLGRVSKNVSIKNESYIIHNCIMFLRAKKELSQFQLYYFISSKQSYFISVSQGSTGQTTLKQSLVGDLEINLPTNFILQLDAANWNGTTWTASVGTKIDRLLATAN
jgi:type I restriction enzyme S subunit